MEETVQKRHRGRVFRQEATPLLEGSVARDAEAAPLIGGGYEAKAELPAGVVQRREAELVNHDQVRS